VLEVNAVAAGQDTRTFIVFTMCVQA